MNDGNAKRADAAETRWKRFVDIGPPPAPVRDQQIQVRIRGGDSARIVVALRDVGDRRARAPVRGRDPLRRARRADRAQRLGQDAPDPAAGRRGRPARGRPADRQPRVGRPVHAAQLARRPVGTGGAGRRARARSASSSRRCARSPATASRRPRTGRPTRSRAGRRRGWRSSASSSRATTCCCSTSRPTTSTSTRAEALEAALETFTGTVVAVSHDRAFLRRLDRFLLLAHDGSVYALPDTERRSPRWPRPSTWPGRGSRSG